MARSAFLILLVVSLLAPATAFAAPSNDNFLKSIALNSNGAPLPGSVGVDDHTIVDATHQNDLMEEDVNAPFVPEPTACVRAGFPSANIDATVWYDVYPHVGGNLRVTVDAGFDAVVAVVPFPTDTDVPDIGKYVCVPAALGHAQLDYPHRLQPGMGYSIAVGSTNATRGTFDMTVTFDPDSDGDGPVDSIDQCPAQPGKPGLVGCPDGDDDGLRDADDRCPAEAGPAGHRGCPDTDGDGLANPDDRCPTQGGAAQHGGCADSDGDGFADPSDACPRENSRKGRDRNQNGCPDRELLKPELLLVPGSYCRGSTCLGIKVERLVVRSLPVGAKVAVSCTKRACKRQSKTAGKSRKVTFFGGQNVKAGVDITVTVTKAGYVGRRQTYAIKRNDLSKGPLGCLAGAKPARCSTKLLVR